MGTGNSMGLKIEPLTFLPLSLSSSCLHLLLMTSLSILKPSSKLQFLWTASFATFPHSSPQVCSLLFPTFFHRHHSLAISAISGLAYLLLPLDFSASHHSPLTGTFSVSESSFLKHRFDWVIPDSQLFSMAWGEGEGVYGPTGEHQSIWEPSETI